MCIINTCNTTTNTCNLPVDKTCQTTASLCDGKYECNSETGNCDFLDIDVLCDDGNSCSIDTCEADSCRHSSIPGCSVPGALMETWSGIEGVLVSDFTSVAAYPDSPDATEPLLNGFEAPLVDRGSNFGSRIRGYLVPFKSGDYTFYIASDDQGELMMSTSEDPDLATVIATVPGWAGSRDFWKYPAEQQSAPITLVKGMRYYIETKYKEGGGGDNMGEPALICLMRTYESPALHVSYYLCGCSSVLCRFLHLFFSCCMGVAYIQRQHPSRGNQPRAYFHVSSRGLHLR